MTRNVNTGNVIRLAAAQALSMTTMNVNIINTALVGSLFAPVPWFATLGLSLQFVSSADYATRLIADGAVWPPAGFYHWRQHRRTIGFDTRPVDSN